MKKSLLLFLFPILAIALLASCGSKAKTSKGSSDEGGVDGEIFKNERLGYSVLVPAEFKEGKGFGDYNVKESSNDSVGIGVHEEVCKGWACCDYEFNICAKVMDYIGGTTPEQSVKQSFEVMKSSYFNPKAKMLDETSFVVIGEKSSSQLQAYIEFQKKGKKVTIEMSYPTEEKEEFKEVIDAVIESIEIK